MDDDRQSQVGKKKANLTLRRSLESHQNTGTKPGHQKLQVNLKKRREKQK